MKPSLFARAVVECVARTPQSPAHVRAALERVLARHKAVKLMPQVRAALQREALRARKHPQAELTVSRESDTAAAHAASRAPERAVVIVDETLSGGWRLRVGSRLVDASHKTHLQDLYARIVA